MARNDKLAYLSDIQDADDVAWFGSSGDFPPHGAEGRMYVAQDSGRIYRWSEASSGYVQLMKPVAPSSSADAGGSPADARETGIRLADIAAAKQDALADPQLDALGVQVEECQTTVVTYSSQTLKFNWTGEVNAQTIAGAGLNGGQAGDGINYIIFGTGVTSIAADTFKGFNLYYVWLSKSIMSIGAGAFQNCPWLYCVFLLDDDNAKMTSGTFTIGDGAFADCGRLAYVELLGYSISSGNNVFTNSPFTIQNVIGFLGLDDRKGIYLKWWKGGEDSAKSAMAAKFDVDPILIHAWNAASVEWARNTFSPTFAFVSAKTQTQLRPVMTTYHQCLSGRNSSVTLQNRLNKIWADGTSASRSDEIAASDFSRELYVRMTAGGDYTGTITWSTYFDWFVGGTMEELMPNAGETAYFHAWEYEPQHFAVERLGTSGSSRYRISDVGLTEGGYVLSDNAVNRVTLPSGTAEATLVFPEKPRGYARDFMVRLVIEGSDAPQISFVEPDGSYVAFDEDDDAWADIGQGVNLLIFTDTSEPEAQEEP